MVESEDEVPLPGDLLGQATAEEQQAMMHFLAMIALRRLVTRVHKTLFEGEFGTSLTRVLRGAGCSVGESAGPPLGQKLDPLLDPSRADLRESHIVVVPLANCQPYQQQARLRRRLKVMAVLLHT